MKSKILLGFSLLGILMNLAVAEGSGRETGNGGFAHVCRDQNEKIISARLLDLWEGVALNTWLSPAPKAEQIERVYKKIESISPAYLDRIKQVMNAYLVDIAFTDRKLSKTDDAFPPYEPGQGCAYEQVARFESLLTETGKPGLRVNREIYQSSFFSESDRAALFIHEAVYWLDRGFRDVTSSFRSRVIVAHLFSDSVVTNEIRLLMGSSANPNPLVLNYAVRDSKKIHIRFGLDNWDGIDKAPGSGKIKYLYRCEIASDGQPISSSWFTEKEINELQINGNPLIQGEVLTGTTAQPGDFEYSIYARCFKKNRSGKVFPLSFKGYVNIPDSFVLMNQLDGSLELGSGDQYSFQIDGRGPGDTGEERSRPMPALGTASQWINFVQMAP